MTERQKRIAYLRNELRVWEARRSRAQASGNPALVAFYCDPDLDRALGQMVRELRELEELEGGRRTMGRRRTRAEHEARQVRQDPVVFEVTAEEAEPVEAPNDGLPF